MTVKEDEHERTMAFAQIALGQIKALRQPATPRHFEVWYAYATGHHPLLNQTINELLQRNGTLDESDIERLHESFISTTRFTQRIDHVGSQVMGEIERVMATIGAAAGDASQYGQSLAAVSDQLGSVADPASLSALIDGLVRATRDMETKNRELEARLTASKEEIAELQRSLDMALTESLTDPLTSLANRKLLDEALARALNEAHENGEPLSVVMMDIDHFKRFNDTFGHLTGDHVLRLVAHEAKQNVKGQDIAARYGGEEFVIVLPNTVLRSAITVADHIRCAVMNKELRRRSTGENLGRVTISGGVATLRKGDTAQTLIERADRCLYAAKRNGRNRVLSEADPETTPMPVATSKVA
ncbi:MAG: GGDEF domain-containing protein [Hyphomicrobiales bacterium]|nr:GGDEF domain-containing protein [Hyphomicrobiales bacterium]